MSSTTSTMSGSGPMNLAGLGLTNPSAPMNTQPAAPVRVAKPADKKGWWWGTGRRKSSVCRARIKPAEGAKAVITIMSAKLGKPKPIEQYFSLGRDRTDALSALTASGMLGRFEIRCTMHGGGTTGQAGAMRMALARALVDFDPALYQALRDGGHLTRDARKVERKKYGLAGARRRYQFSKR